MPVPAGYTIDKPTPPAGYTLDTPTPKQSPQQGFFSSAADSSGLSGLAHAIAHPIDTVAGLPSALKGAYHQTADNIGQAVDAAKTGNYAGAISHGVSAIPILGSTLDKATDQYADKNYAGEMGTLTGLSAGLVAPVAASKALAAAPEALSGLGTTLEDAGVNRMNKAVGSRLADFKRGADPGRAYLEAGGGPATSMSKLSDNALALKGSVGKQIGNMRASTTAAGLKIPTEDVAGALQPAIDNGIKLQTGPGGSGSVSPIEDYSATFRPTLKNGIDAGGISPSDLYSLKKSIKDNIGSWADSTGFNLNTIRQNNVGALSGLETKAIPEISPLKTQFQGLTNFANRAEGRSLTGSEPLSSLTSGLGKTVSGAAIGSATGNPLLAVGGAIAANAGKSLGLKTALATGMYRGGGVLGRAGDALVGPASILPSSVIPPYNLLANKKKLDGDESD